jgi:hypothetical protein
LAALDGSSGLVPGVLAPYGRDHFTFPSSTRIEVVNVGKGVLHVAINPAGNDFNPWTPGSQIVLPEESVEIAVTGTPTVVLRRENLGGVYQVRRLA